jgi:hypothetical protein
MKKLVLFSFLTISLHAQENFVKPTLEQIINSQEVSIRIKANIRDDSYDKQLWKEITLEVNDLINKCYASDDNEFTTEQIFAEIHKTIDFVRERTHAENGIYGLVEIHVGQPGTNKNDPKENT